MVNRAAHRAATQIAEDDQDLQRYGVSAGHEALRNYPWISSKLEGHVHDHLYTHTHKMKYTDSKWTRVRFPCLCFMPACVYPHTQHMTRAPKKRILCTCTHTHVCAYRVFGIIVVHCKRPAFPRLPLRAWLPLCTGLSRFPWFLWLAWDLLSVTLNENASAKDGVT